MNLKIYSESDFPTYLPKLGALYDELFAGGKGFRAKLVQTVSQALDAPENTIQLLCQTIEFIHNSSLLHDDLIDHSPLRRGKTSAWLKYTPEYAVLAGDYLLARVMVNLSHFGNIDLIQLTSQSISDLLEGEWLQDSIVKNPMMKPEDIDRVHSLKTSSLFKWCLKAPYVALKHDNPQTFNFLNQAGEILGLLLQRSDDLLDFDIRNFEKKAVMGDLKAGYVNSFCAHLFSSMSDSEKQTAFLIHDLDQFKQSIGHEVFNEKLQTFDQNNQKLIDQFLGLIDECEKQIPAPWNQGLSCLKALPQPIYWRE